MNPTESWATGDDFEFPPDPVDLQQQELDFVPHFDDDGLPRVANLARLPSDQLPPTVLPQEYGARTLGSTLRTVMAGAKTWSRKRPTGGAGRNGGGASQQDDAGTAVPRDEDTYRWHPQSSRAAPWSETETAAFYNALQQFGQNFSMIAVLFPGKSRKEVVAKFNYENKRNPSKIQDALMPEQELAIDMDRFHECARECDRLREAPVAPLNEEEQEMLRDVDRRGTDTTNDSSVGDAPATDGRNPTNEAASDEVGGEKRAAKPQPKGRRKKPRAKDDEHTNKKEPSAEEPTAPMHAKVSSTDFLFDGLETAPHEEGNAPPPPPAKKRKREPQPKKARKPPLKKARAGADEEPHRAEVAPAPPVQAPEVEVEPPEADNKEHDIDAIQQQLEEVPTDEFLFDENEYGAAEDDDFM